MKNNFSQLRKQQGFTLIELVVVLAVLGVLAFVGKTAADKFTSSGNLEAAKKEIQLVFDYAGKVNPNSARYDAPTALSIESMNDRNLVPELWDDGANANIYGGDIAAAALAGTPTRFTITYGGIPNDEDGLHLVDTFTGVSLVAPVYAAGTLTLVGGLR